MDLSAFYAVVSGINFTLLGLWWVAVKERPELAGRDPIDRRMAYLVSLQFVVPGVMALLSQVAPTVTILWRSSFAFAGIAGAVGIAMLAIPLRRENGHGAVTRLLLWLVVPLYLAIAVVAASPEVTEAIRGDLTPLQVEAILLCVMVFLGVQSAWIVAMSPKAEVSAQENS